MKTLSDNQNSIQCDFCKRWISLKCSGISYKDFQNYSNYDKPWFFWSCSLASFAFTLLIKVLKISDSNQKKKNKNLEEGIPFYSVYIKRNKHIESSEKCIPCVPCQGIICTLTTIDHELLNLQD